MKCGTDSCEAGGKLHSTPRANPTDCDVSSRVLFCVLSHLRPVGRSQVWMDGNLVNEKRQTAADLHTPSSLWFSRKDHNNIPRVSPLATSAPNSYRTRDDGCKQGVRRIAKAGTPGSLLSENMLSFILHRAIAMFSPYSAMQRTVKTAGNVGKQRRISTNTL